MATGAPVEDVDPNENFGSRSICEFIALGKEVGEAATDDALDLAARYARDAISMADGWSSAAAQTILILIGLAMMPEVQADVDLEESCHD